MEIYKIIKSGILDILFLSVLTVLLIIYMVIPLWGI